jgi:hypothetical protein
LNRNRHPHEVKFIERQLTARLQTNGTIRLSCDQLLSRVFTRLQTLGQLIKVVIDCKVEFLQDCKRMERFIKVVINCRVFTRLQTLGRFIKVVINRKVQY